MGGRSSAGVARHFLKHPIDHTDVEVHMPVQAGAESVDEGYGPDVQGGPVHMGRPGAVGLQRCAAVSTMRRVLHEGHTPRPLQE